MKDRKKRKNEGTRNYIRSKEEINKQKINAGHPDIQIGEQKIKR